MKWTAVYLAVFGRTQWLGLNMGFWISMGAVVFIVILMNVVFWSMKPDHNRKQEKREEGKDGPERKYK